jgi:hypothetical protein
MAVDTNKLAELGAQTRLTQLENERQEILGMFPALANGNHHQTAWPDAAQAILDAGKELAPNARRRGRKPMSAAQRAVVAARMKKYWAQRRKATGKN